MSTAPALQVEHLTGEIKDVTRGEVPKVDLQLADAERVVSVSVRQRVVDDPERKTVDWRWHAYVCRRWA